MRLNTGQHCVACALGASCYLRLTVWASACSCGLTAAGAAFCWGSGTFGQVGAGPGKSCAQLWLPLPRNLRCLLAAALTICSPLRRCVQLGNGKNGSASAQPPVEYIETAPVAVAGGHAFSAIRRTGLRLVAIACSWPAGPWAPGECTHVRLCHRLCPALQLRQSNDVRADPGGPGAVLGPGVYRGAGHQQDAG